MSDRQVWELVAGARVVGHARWIGGRELVAEAPWPLARQLESWFDQRVLPLAEQEISPGVVRNFFVEELRARVGLRAVPLVDDRVPGPARWLRALDHDRMPANGVRDPLGWSSNRWSPDFDLEWLVRETARGVVWWGRGSTVGFKAGGRCPDSTEMWLTLFGSGSRYTLILRHRRSLWCRPVTQVAGWFRRPPLQRLCGLLESRLPPRPR